ncbi:MAG: DNA translocase FtsK, partial [Paraburkholderia sp.]|nr:DNA translocase FtsK [Paraburkholderia sp.]
MAAPITSQSAQTSPATPAYSRPSADGTKAEAPLSTSVLETLRSIEENAARWTTLAGASLARRTVDEAGAMQGAEQTPVQLPNASLEIAPVAVPASATAVPAPVQQEVTCAPLMQHDRNDFSPNAGIHSVEAGQVVHEAGIDAQPGESTTGTASATHAAFPPAATQNAATSEAPSVTSFTRDQTSVPSPWQRAPADVQAQSASSVIAREASPESIPAELVPPPPPEIASASHWPMLEHGMPWILLDDEPKLAPPAEIPAAEPFVTFTPVSVQDEAPQPPAAGPAGSSHVTVTVPMQPPAAASEQPAQPAPAEAHHAPDTPALSNVVHFPRRERQHDTAAAPATHAAPLSERTPEADATVDVVETAATIDVDESAPVTPAYGTYGGTLESSARTMPAYAAATFSHAASATPLDAAPQTASESHSPSLDAPAADCAQPRVAVSAAAEAPSAIAGLEAQAPQAGYDVPGRVPLTAPLAASHAAAIAPGSATPSPVAPATSPVPAPVTTPPWVADAQAADYAAPVEAVPAPSSAPITSPLASAAAPYPAVPAERRAASPDLRPAHEAPESLDSPEPPAPRGPVRGHAPTSFAFEPLSASAVELPGLDLLECASSEIEPVSEEKLAETSQLIEQRLQEFKVPVTVVGASAGPVITRFEVEPALGVRGSQIVGLMKDLSRGLGLTSIRVVETIPGKTCMGLELPNARRQMIRLSEILESPQYQRSQSKLTIAMGKDIVGHPIVTDLAKAPHMLVAGTTGSGKSVAINAMILSLLYKATPADVRLI